MRYLYRTKFLQGEEAGRKNLTKVKTEWFNDGWICSNSSKTKDGWKLEFRSPNPEPGNVIEKKMAKFIIAFEWYRDPELFTHYLEDPEYWGYQKYYYDNEEKLSTLAEQLKKYDSRYGMHSAKQVNSFVLAYAETIASEEEREEIAKYVKENSK